MEHEHNCERTALGKYGLIRINICEMLAQSEGYEVSLADQFDNALSVGRLGE